MTTLKQQIENAKLPYPDPQVGEHLIDAAIDARLEEILDDEDRYHELLEDVARDPDARRAVKEMVEYVRAKHSSVTTSEETLVEALVVAAAEMAEDEVMEGRWPPEEEV